MENQEFGRSDLGLCAFLSMKHKLLRLDKTDPKKVIFIFESTEELLKDANEYWNGGGDFQEYYKSIRTLKNRIYDE